MDDDKFHVNEVVTVKQILINDKRSNANATIVRKLSYGEYKGKYLVRIHGCGTEIVVAEDKLEKQS